MKTRQLIVILASMLFSFSAFANYEVEKLLDAYVVAKAESQQTQMTEDEIKKTPYTIQVASYINEKDAVSHVEELKQKEKDKDVQYFPSFVRGQVWFKVCVGKFESKEKAEEFRKSFIKKHDEPFAVVVSRLDRPDSKKRIPASVAQRESSPVPVNSNVETTEAKKSLPQIKLIPKAVKPDIKSENNMAVKTEKAAHVKAENTPVAKAEKASSAKVDHNMAAPELKSEKMTTHEHAKAAEAIHKQHDSVHASSDAIVKKQSDDQNEFYSIQIGAYPTEELAKENLSSMKSKGVDLYYKIAFVNGKKWYRLFMGKFKSKKDAEAYHKELTHDKADAFIRRVTASEQNCDRTQTSHIDVYCPHNIYGECSYVMGRKKF